MNIEISNCSAVRAELQPAGYFHPCLPSENPTQGFHSPFLGVSKDPHPAGCVPGAQQGPLVPSQQGGDSGAAAALTVPLKEPSVKLFLRIKRAFTAFIFHVSHPIKDLEVPAPRGNKIMVSKKYKLVEREIILNI